MGPEDGTGRSRGFVRRVGGSVALPAPVPQEVPALPSCGISSLQPLSLFKTDLLLDLPATELVLFHLGLE